MFVLRRLLDFSRFGGCVFRMCARLSRQTRPAGDRLHPGQLYRHHRRVVAAKLAEIWASRWCRRTASAPAAP